MRSILRKVAVLSVGAAALTAALAIPANADPANPPTAIAAVGSDTIEFLQNHLSDNYNAANPSSPTVGSWNATNPTTGAVHEQITIKAGQPSIQRPDGSSEGITALESTSYVDIARSSRAPKAGDVDPATNLPLLFVRLAQDTVQYALSGTTPTHGSKTLSAAQLKTIYTTPGITWNQVDSTNPSTAVIQAMIPQSGSGTRSFFLGSIGVTDGTGGTLRSDVITVQEHDYTPIQNNADALAPFSVARFKTTVPAGAIILDTVPGGYSAVRFVYNVVRNAGTSTAPQVPSNLVPFIGQFAAGNTTQVTGGYICSTAGQNQVTTDGFTVIARGGCGVVEHS